MPHEGKEHKLTAGFRRATSEEVAERTAPTVEQMPRKLPKGTGMSKGFRHPTPEELAERQAPAFRRATPEEVAERQGATTSATTPEAEEQPSDPFLQFGAGASDIITGIPALLGLIGGGIEGGVNWMFNDGTKSFGAEFSDAISQGADKTLLEASASAQDAVNNFLGIEHATSPTDIIARGMGGFHPIPGLGIAGAAAKLGSKASAAAVKAAAAAERKRKLMNTAAHAVNLLTPAVRMGKGQTLRAAGQLGAGVVLDNSFRALIGAPTVFGMPEEEQANPQEVLSEGFRRGAPDDDAKLAHLRELDAEAQQDQDDADTRSNWLLLAGLVGGYGGAKYARYLSKNKANKAGPEGLKDKPPNKAVKLFDDLDPANLVRGGVTKLPQNSVRYVKETPGILWQAKADATQAIKEGFVSSQFAIADALRKMGYESHHIDQVLANSHTDTTGIAQTIIDTGKMGQGAPAGKASTTVHKLEIELHSLDEPTRQLFNQAMYARTLINSGKRLKDSTMWSDGFGHVRLDKILAEAMQNPQLARMMNEYGEIADDMLDYLTHRGLFTPEQAAEIRKIHKIDGINTYMPLIQGSHTTFMQRLSSAFGIHSSRGAELDDLGASMTRSGADVSAGTNTPINPVDAMRSYIVQAVDVANSESFRWHTLTRLAGLGFDKLGKVTRPFGRYQKDANELRFNPSGRDIDFIGRAPVQTSGKGGKFATIAKNPLRKTQFEPGDAAQLKAQAAKDEMLIVRHNGEDWAFHVPDPAIRAALELNPKLGGALQFFNHYKSLFTRLTTGNMSVFAPFSHAFSAQQVANNTFAKEGFYQALASFWNGTRGTADLMITNGSKEIATYLAVRIASNNGIAKLAPNIVPKLETMFQRLWQKSLLHQVQSETGVGSNSIAGATFARSIQDFGDSVMQNFTNKYGPDQMRFVWRFWKQMNNAVHQGPVYGAQIKRMRQMSKKVGRPLNAKETREAVEYGRSLGGNMQLVGASKAAVAFNAAVPFSAATIQSWSTIGSAIKANPGRFLAGAATLIGIPTMSEMMYTKMMDEGETFADPSGNGKMWSYNDYYWNGYTSQQRAANFIIMIPGKPPWEAALMPVSPEWGLFRSIVMDSMDAIFGLSQVGNIKDVDVNRKQIWASLDRVLDIPLPPPVALAFSAAGVDVRVGVSQDLSTDAENPGAGISFARAIASPGGERYSRRPGEAKYADSVIDTTTLAMMQDVLGAAGGYLGMITEAFSAATDRQGFWGSEEGSLGKGLNAAGAAFGDGLMRSFKIGQPVLGKSLHPNSNDEIGGDLFIRRTSLERLATDFNTYYTGGRMGTNGELLMGNTNPPIPDPVNRQLSASAKVILQNIKLGDKELSRLKQQKASLGNATNMSQREKVNQLDTIELKISTAKAQQLAVINNFEDQISQVLSQQFGRPIDIDLATYAARGQ